MKYQRVVQTSVFGDRFRNKIFYNFRRDRYFQLYSKVFSIESLFVIKIQLSQIHTESNLITSLGKWSLLKQHEAPNKLGKTCSLELIIVINFVYPAVLLCTVFKGFSSSSILLASISQKHRCFCSLTEIPSLPSFILSFITKNPFF